MGAGLWNRGNVILGVYGRWYGETITGKPVRLGGLKMDLGLVVSNDAIHYREPVRDFLFIERGSPADWDSEALLQGNAFANVGGQTLIWYSHWYTSLAYPLPPLPAKGRTSPRRSPAPKPAAPPISTPSSWKVMSTPAPKPWPGSSSIWRPRRRIGLRNPVLTHRAGAIPGLHSCRHGKSSSSAATTSAEAGSASLFPLRAR